MVLARGVGRDLRLSHGRQSWRGEIRARRNPEAARGQAAGRNGITSSSRSAANPHGTWLNEKTVIDQAPPPGRSRQGPVGLQHPGKPLTPDMPVEFANFLLKELP